MILISLSLPSCVDLATLGPILGGGGNGGGGYGYGYGGGGGGGGGGYGYGGGGGGGLQQAKPIIERILPGSGRYIDVAITVVKISEALNSNSSQRNYARQQYAESRMAQRKVQPGEPRYVGVKTKDPSSGKKGVIIVSRKTGEVVDNKLYIPEAPVQSGSVTRLKDKDCVIM